MNDSIIETIMEEFVSLKEKQKECQRDKDLLEQLEQEEIIIAYNELVKKCDEEHAILEKSDDDLLNEAYKSNLNLVEESFPKYYVYLGTFQRGDASRDYLVDRDSLYATYSVYGSLIGKDDRTYVAIEDRPQFERENEIILLSDNMPYMVYYNLRSLYLKTLVKQGHEEAISKCTKKITKKMI